MNVDMPESRFLKLRCKCRNEQITFDRAAITVKCLVCGETLAEPTGGKARILTNEVEEVDS